MVAVVVSGRVGVVRRGEKMDIQEWGNVMLWGSKWEETKKKPRRILQKVMKQKKGEERHLRSERDRGEID